MLSRCMEDEFLMCADREFMELDSLAARIGIAKDWRLMKCMEILWECGKRYSLQLQCKTAKKDDRLRDFQRHHIGQDDSSREGMGHIRMIYRIMIYSILFYSILVYSILC